ncbi:MULTISPECIES: NUDIX domain-containing protein [unclassified Beijerinckia]|uniref:NUDIX hydrolase n=1 Tax=unclassified Beijerinckia TaxID=2638183 RepID=UPI00089BC852|nr:MULTISPECIES: NUDIX domain-containing protein [unclassified Beijerinckia]MDH7798686.1 8-oxo-dGTP diphosphatase [Beijerinckia sp. GAS462]SED29396.1 ADP-ribose pyrophosphatase YjhB, NUDIX family [Beijerinckia sp. 28-YEA-48]
MTTSPSSIIRIASAIINDPSGQTLLVRKKGALAFMQAGGKIDSGETSLEALRRELREELSLDIGQCDIAFVGQFEAVAANEPGHIVIADIFRLSVASAAIQPSAEIEEVVWVDPKSPPPITLAPLTRDHILPIA